MRTRYLGEILAMLLVGSSAFLFIHLDSHGILSCVPLLLGLLAIHRGATWAAFAVLAGASGLLALTIAGRAPWLLAVGAGSALIPILIVLPALWRFDRLATPLLSGLALALGITAALVSYSGPAEKSGLLERPVVHNSVRIPAMNEEVPPIIRYAQVSHEGPCVAADLVGIYENEHGVLRLSADGRFTHKLTSGATTSGSFQAAGSRVLLRTKGSITRIGCDEVTGGRSMLHGYVAWEVAR